MSDIGQDNEIIYGEIINIGTDTEPPLVENPVALSHSMSGAEKTRRAMALKLAGASYAQIAVTLGYHDASGARKAVQRGMKNALHETAGELKKIHYGRLEHMLMLIWPEVNQRDLPAMSAALAIMDRMEKLFALNDAQKIDIGVGRETVILADGDKESYIQALNEAGQRLHLPLSSNIPSDNDDTNDGDEHDDATSDTTSD
jgi:hypothetical protein